MTITISTLNAQPTPVEAGTADAPFGAVRQREERCDLLLSPVLARQCGRPPSSSKHAARTPLEPGRGTLIIADERLVFESPETGVRIAIEYPTIAVHAISREPPSIYCQLGAGAVVDDRSPEEASAAPLDGPVLDKNGAPNDEEHGDDDDEIGELRIVPADSTRLDAIFQALSECAALHPDPQDGAEGDEGDEAGEDDNDELDTSPGAGGWFTAASFGGEVDPRIAAMLDAAAAEAGQFDDAEEAAQEAKPKNKSDASDASKSAQPDSGER